ncbi:4796_t:CDS:1 [Ambispora leptoticha]|uniref:4796_t:CDS:1 n=1 Tax=Ambispora leptoticha TaxID=144679 RepID=A0A9N9A7E2_9GLOM|nr:4796_t:CDS:1 [Ambispora leptoticha]
MRNRAINLTKYLKYSTLTRNSEFLRFSSYFKLPKKINNCRNQLYHNKYSLSIPKIKNVTTSVNELVVNWSDNTDSHYSYIWLRDNCNCVECIHPASRQKLHSSAQIPLNIEPISTISYDEGIEILWGKELLKDVLNSPSKNAIHHKSIYTPDFLHSYKSTRNILSKRFNDLPITHWDASLMRSKNLWVNYDEFINSDRELLSALKQIWNYGLVFLRDVPAFNSLDGKEGIIKVVERIGSLQNTIYGSIWDVKSKPDSRNIAYTELELGLHMDLLYYEASPGLQFLHCLKNTVNGGKSIFADSFMAVTRLQQQYPKDYEILTKVPMTFHYINDGHFMHFNRPVIVIDQANDSMVVNYSPPFQGPIETGFENNDNNHSPIKNGEIPMREFYRAFQRFSSLVEAPELRFELLLNSGELAIFANRRVLHGRRRFDAESGERHLKGAYLDMSEFKDRLRVLLMNENQKKL